MLAKPYDASLSRHDFEHATQLALRQLERSLLDLPDLRVFNGLRLLQAQHVLNLDHLVLHRHGFILLENASMMLELQVNTMGEWTHLYCDAPLRIPSPSLQVERKLKRLHSFLEPHAQVLRQERSQQFYFYPLSFQKLVVVADDVKLQVPRGLTLPDLVKASQLPKKVQQLAAESRRKARATLGYKAKGLELSDPELYKISAFLRSQHEPFEPKD
jgi:Nuclease-related domain